MAATHSPGGYIPTPDGVEKPDWLLDDINCKVIPASVVREQFKDSLETLSR